MIYRERDLFIYGSGATGREILDIVRRIHLQTRIWESIYFVDDISDASMISGILILRFRDMIDHHSPFECVVAHGEPYVRSKLLSKLRGHDVCNATVIDPTAIISPFASIGAGCIVGPGSFVSCGASLGDNALIEINCIVGHDVRVGCHTVISSGTALGGGSQIGQVSFIGMNATVRERVCIGDRSIIGMAAAVFNDIPDDVIALGNLARVMRKNEEHRVFK